MNSITRNKASILLAGALAMAAAGAAMAQGLGAVVAAKQNPLPVYANAGDAKATGSVSAANLPWPIKESRNEFFKVAVEGRDVWIDSMDVRADRQSAHRCAKVPGAKDVAGTPGAAGKNC
jgi:hypothetical protein